MSGVVVDPPVAGRPVGPKAQQALGSCHLLEPTDHLLVRLGGENLGHGPFHARQTAGGGYPGGTQRE